MVEIIIITLLILLGTLLIVAELLLIPGITVAAIGAVASFVAAVVMSYINYGFNVAIVVLLVSIAISTATLLICTRKKSLKKISLNETIDSKVTSSTHNLIEVGAIITSTSRLAPMGNVVVNGETFQAKSISGYIEPQSKVIVVGHEDSTIVVKLHQ